MKLITLFLTCASRQEAKRIGDTLLEKRLAACVRATGVESGFWWQGQRQQAAEILLIVETSEDKYDAIEAAVQQLHSYQTFVLMAYPVLRASKGVEEWVKGALA